MIYAVIAALVLSSILVSLGYVVGASLNTQGADIVNIRQMDTAALRTLRIYWETSDEGMTEEQGIALIDVCFQIGLSESQMQTAVGPFAMMCEIEE